MVLDTDTNRYTHQDLKIKLHGEVFKALHLNPFQDAFSPTRNNALENAWKVANRESGGADAFPKLLGENLDWADGTISTGKIVLRNLSTNGYRYTPDDIEIKITSKIQERGQWWNGYSKRVFKEKGIEGLIADPSKICLALGMGQWLDAGNIFAEPRYIGNSLVYPQRSELDLYNHFGVTPDTFALYPHIKHLGLYRKPYNTLLNSNHISSHAAYDSFEEIKQIMELNKIKYLAVQGTWFLDPVLTDPSSPVYSEEYSWAKDIAQNSIEIGPAHEINPVLTDYALMGNWKRKRASEAGLYIPKVFATIITFDQLSETLAKTKRT